MAVGLLIGTEHLDDFDGYIKTMEAVGKIFNNLHKISVRSASSSIVIINNSNNNYGQPLTEP